MMKLKGIKQNRIASMFVEESISHKMASKKRLVIKSGIDASSPDAHLGHLVGLLLLREFQELGHKIVFVIGDFTAQLGDGVKREKLDLNHTTNNTPNHIELAKKILNRGELEIHRQSEWFDKMSIEQLINKLSSMPVKKLTRHSTFKKRIEGANPLMVHELIYPFLMAHDSVILKPDIEIGSLEQKFNFQFTRGIMKKEGLLPEDFILNKRLPGIDGSSKMSKSENNFLGVFEDIDSQLKKLLSIPDHLIPIFFELLTNIKANDLAILENDIATDVSSARDIKLKLAQNVLELFHNKVDIAAAVKVTLGKDKSTIRTHNIELKSRESIIEFLLKNNFANSKRELKRLIVNDTISVNKKIISLETLKNTNVDVGDVIIIGKKTKIELCPK